jgi:hypothetical protein
MDSERPARTEIRPQNERLADAFAMSAFIALRTPAEAEESSADARALHTAMAEHEGAIVLIDEFNDSIPDPFGLSGWPHLCVKYGPS